MSLVYKEKVIGASPQDIVTQYLRLQYFII